MKKDIHREYTSATIVCSCGNRIETRSTQEEIHVEICAVCHPFYTGRQKLVDTAGRVERFKKKYGDTSTGEVPDAEGEAGEEPAGDEAAAEDEAAGGETSAPAPEAATDGGPEETGGGADEEAPRKVAAGTAGEGAGEEDAEAEA